MGAWGYAPWDNDSAADWFGDLFDATGLADRVEEALRLDAEEYHEEIRAATMLVIMLGHTYIWPIEKLDEHIQVAIARLKEVRELDVYQEVPKFVRAIEDEIAILQARTTKEGRANLRVWSDFWKPDDSMS